MSSVCLVKKLLSLLIYTGSFVVFLALDLLRDAGISIQRDVPRLSLAMQTSAPSSRLGLGFPICVTSSLPPDTWVLLSQLLGEDTEVRKGEMVYQDQRTHTRRNLVTPSPPLSPWTQHVPSPQLRWPRLAPGPRTCHRLRYHSLHLSQSSGDKADGSL